MLLWGISCTKVLYDKCTGLGGHGQVCTDWTDWRVWAWAHGYMIQPLCLFSRLKITTLPLSLCRSRERNTRSSQTGPDTAASLITCQVPSRAGNWRHQLARNILKKPCGWYSQPFQTAGDKWNHCAFIQLGITTRGLSHLLGGGVVS